MYFTSYITMQRVRAGEVSKKYSMNVGYKKED
jgi:hypothetical protein